MLIQVPLKCYFQDTTPGLLREIQLHQEFFKPIACWMCTRSFPFCWAEKCRQSWYFTHLDTVLSTCSDCHWKWTKKQAAACRSTVYISAPIDRSGWNQQPDSGCCIVPDSCCESAEHSCWSFPYRECIVPHLRCERTTGEFWYAGAERNIGQHLVACRRNILFEFTGCAERDLVQDQFHGQ